MSEDALTIDDFKADYGRIVVRFECHRQKILDFTKDHIEMYYRHIEADCRKYMNGEKL